MNKATSKVCALVLLTYPLFGCGGGDGDNTTTTVDSAPFNGKVIDGYISGAKVFVDLNNNGIADNDEPTAITDETGDFQFTPTQLATAQCWKFAPLVAIVEKGVALDEGQPVTDTYKMTFPPTALTDASSGDAVAITPLTSQIWNGANKEMLNPDMAQLCMAQNSSQVTEEMEVARNNAIRAIRTSEQSVADTHKQTVTKLYDDYIAGGDEQAHSLAKKVVTELQTEYAAETKAKESNPDAEYVRVSYYYQAEQRYQHTFIAKPDGYELEIILVDEQGNLQRKDYYEQMRYTYNTEKTIKLESSRELSYDAGTLTCSLSEDYKQMGEISYGLENIALRENVSGWDECQQVSLAKDPEIQILNKRIRNNNVLIYTTKLYYKDIVSSGFKDYFDLGGNVNNITNSILNQLNYIDGNFQSNEAHGSPKWSRIFYDYSLSGNQYQRDSHDEAGIWHRTVYQSSGKRTYYCGPSYEQVAQHGPYDSKKKCPL